MFIIIIRNESGMTLAEVSVAVIIILLLLNIGISYFVPVEKRQLQNVAEDFKNNVKNMQRLALSEGTEYKIAFDAETFDSYYVLKASGTGYKNVRTVYLPNGVKVSEDSTSSSIIEFSSRGTIASASTTIFVSRSYKVEVTCAVGTGKVSVKDIRN